MRIFGLSVPFTGDGAKDLSPVRAGTGWFRILESWPGAWQHNVEVKRDLVVQNPTVFACTTLIASDIAKLRVRLVALDSDGIWTETTSPAYSPVLRKPNHFQSRIQFWESWILSKLLFGNTYVLKERDNRNVVVGLYVLDPRRVMPLVSDDGSVYYQLSEDNLSDVQRDIVVPAQEIIHDRYNCLFHPLVGLSPIFAAGLVATQGNTIQSSSSWFFGNKSMPGGILTAPGAIHDDTAARLKEHWDTHYSGRNAGKVAVLGDGLSFQPIAASARDSQVTEQLKWTADTTCGVYHVPPWKIGLAPMPSATNVQALNVEYYSLALQKLIEDAENCLDDGLGLGDRMGTEFEVDGLLRMDTLTQLDVLERAKSVMTLDERRRRLDLKKITGGDTVYLQQQDHSIEAIAARDKILIEQANAPQPQVQSQEPEDETDVTDKAIRYMRLRLGVA